jgi:membrane fusion protein, multidrug efflux system
MLVRGKHLGSRLQLVTRALTARARHGGHALAILSVTLLVGCDGEEAEQAADIRPVRVVIADESTAGETVSLAGTVESQTSVDLAFRIGGRITERLVEVGDAVAPGQVVARLDPEDERSALRAAEANARAAAGQLTEARVNYDRQRQLFERGIAAQAAFDRAEQVLQTAQSAYEATEAQVALARSRLSDTELVADAPGVVTATGANVGEVVQAGRPIVQVARDDGRDAVFDVPETLLTRSPPDPLVTVTLSLDRNVSAEGRVREVAPQADAVTGTFRVRVGLIDPPAAMRLGSTVSGRITIGGRGGIELPSTALTSVDGQPAVWIVDPGTMEVALRPIGVASFGPASVTVTDGVEPGEMVVTAGVQALRPGQVVRLQESGT